MESRHVKHVVTLTIVLFGLWLLLSGHLDALLLVLGALSCIFVGWLAQRMAIVDEESYPFSLSLRLPVYWAWLLKEIVKSNLDVARRALGSRARVAPVVADIEAGQRTDLGQVVFANSITLTPGTVSLEVRPGRIRVHAIHREVLDGLRDSGMNEHVPDPGASTWR